MKPFFTFLLIIVSFSSLLASDFEYSMPGERLILAPLVRGFSGFDSQQGVRIEVKLYESMFPGKERYGFFAYAIDSEKRAVITQYWGSDTTVEIPITINEMEVVGVNERIFSWNRRVEAVTVAENHPNLASHDGILYR